ncbi:flippase [Bacillus cereus group sp. TH230-1LC]|nr:flippase [Bacillus cereus group sp. TH230-1LC]
MIKVKERYIRFKKEIMNSEVANKVINNFSWLVGEKIFTMIIGVLVTALIARYFGPEEYGKFNYALAVVSIFTVISVLGLETLTVKSIVDNKYDEGTILCTSLFLRLIGGVMLTGIACLTISIIQPDDKALHILVFLMSFTMILKSFEVIEYWIQANQKGKISSTIRIGAYVFGSMLKVLLIIFEGGLFTFAIIYSIDALVVGLALMIAYFKIREKISPWTFSIKYAKEILSKSWYLIISGFMVTMYMRVDQIMLGSMLQNKTELGLYSAAVKIAEMWYFVPMAVIASFNPVIMKNKKLSESSYYRSVQTLYNLVAWLGLIFGVIILIFAKPIVSLLYGPDYINASNILAISIWGGIFAMLGSARSSWLICENLQKYSMVYIFAGCITNIILNFFLIPSLQGYGAAIATLISQILVVLIVPALFKETRVSVYMLIRAFSLKGILKYIKLK